MAITRSLSDKISELLICLSTLTTQQLADVKKKLDGFADEINLSEEKNPEILFDSFLKNNLAEVGKIIFSTIEIDQAIRQELYLEVQRSLFQAAVTKELMSRGIKSEDINDSVIWDGVTNEDIKERVKDNEISEKIGAPEITNRWFIYMPQISNLYSKDTLAKVSLLAEWLMDSVGKLNTKKLGVGERAGPFLQLEHRIKSRRDDLLGINDKVQVITQKAKAKTDPLEAEIEKLNEEKRGKNDKDKAVIDKEIKKNRQKIAEINRESGKQIDKIESEYNIIREKTQKNVEKNLFAEKKLNRANSFNLFGARKKEDKTELTRIHSFNVFPLRRKDSEPRVKCVEEMHENKLSRLQ